MSETSTPAETEPERTPEPSWSYFVLSFPLVILPCIGVMIPPRTLGATTATSVYGLMYNLPASFPMIPFVAFASIASLYFVHDPKSVSRLLWARWGVTSGIFVGAYFAYLTSETIPFELSRMFLWSLLPLLLYLPSIFNESFMDLVSFIRQGLGENVFRMMALTLGLIIGLTLILIIFFEPGILLLVLIVSLVLAGPWYCLIEILLSIRIWTVWLPQRSSTPKVESGWIRFLPVALVGAFISSVQLSAKLAELYRETLPRPAPQDCFIATAAAQGHPSVVRSWEIQTEDGQATRVNRQLLVLKEFESSIRESAPRSHMALRFVYNRVGPIGARLIRPKVLADVAYFLLKPVEWFACLACRLDRRG